MKALKKLLELRKRQDYPIDRVVLGEGIVIELRKDGQTVKKLEVKGSTWLPAGLTEIAKWLAGESAVAPTSIGFEATNVAAARSRSTTIAIWEATFPASGALSGRYFYLRGGGITHSSIDVGISFTKPDGTELVVRWETTITV